MAALAPPLPAHQTTTTHSPPLAPKPRTEPTLAPAPTAPRWVMEVSVVLLRHRERHRAITVHRHQLQPLLPSSRLMLVMHLRHTADSLRRHLVGNPRRLILDNPRHHIAGSLKRQGGEGMGMMGLGMRKGRLAREKVANGVTVSALWVCLS